ncbi:UNVERIFIED_CONTAM: Phosphatidylinositol/phosphatidylcholine transfer protein SFH9 [Sesamum angustifolium]|uniref:Phosphatidylinositol/phosphatidylcholine transfer protein SFH9 n=1 Tax=Sesamum angustifolium TaxID=2727405 RepID=A0AAW2QQV5_9LAMI
MPLVLEEIALVHGDERGRRSDHEIMSENEKRRRRMRSLRRKAMSASTRITPTLNKHSKGVLNCQFASISAEEFLDEEEEKAVNAFRRTLIERGLLPSRHDDYHTMLRFLKARKFDLDKTVHMWAEMLNWRKENGVDSIIQVLGTKFQNKLLEVIDTSQLPDFLGGSCSCPDERGCLGSNKGPWNDPQLMKLVHALHDNDAIYLKRITSFSDNDDLESKLHDSKALLATTSKQEELSVSLEILKEINVKVRTIVVNYLRGEPIVFKFVFFSSISLFYLLLPMTGDQELLAPK